MACWSSMVLCLAWHAGLWPHEPTVAAKPWNFGKKFERPLKCASHAKFKTKTVWVNYQWGGYGLIWPKNSLKVLPLACHAYLACSYHPAAGRKPEDLSRWQDLLALPELGGVAGRLDPSLLLTATCLMGLLLWIGCWLWWIAWLWRRRRRAERSVRQLYRLNRQLSQLANTDELTGLYNRRGFALRTYHAKQHAERTGQPLSVALIDLDQFKQVNDEYGHLTGDAVLRKVADEIRQAIDEDMLVGRRGGDELVICMPGQSLVEALASCEYIRKWVAEHPLQTMEQTIWVRCSFGVAQWCAGDSWRSLLTRADEGLYRAKRQGGDRVETVQA